MEPRVRVSVSPKVAGHTFTPRGEKLAARCVQDPEEVGEAGAGEHQPRVHGLPKGKKLDGVRETCVQSFIW